MNIKDFSKCRLLQDCCMGEGLRNDDRGKGEGMAEISTATVQQKSRTLRDKGGKESKV